HAAICAGLVRSCHDLSEGGLAVALAEMAVAGGLGIHAALADIPQAGNLIDECALLFSESPTRFLLEVRPQDSGELERLLAKIPFGRIGHVGSAEAGGDGASPRVIVQGRGKNRVVDASVSGLRRAWQRPLQTL